MDENYTIDLTKEIFVNGIDPGPVNCGITTYDPLTGKIETLRKVGFRKKRVKDANGKKKSSDTDLGHAKLLEQVTQYITNNENIFSDKLTFIENQFSEDILSNEVQGPHKSEAKAIQIAFQALLGKNKCIPVAPNAVKQHFPEYFPRLQGISHLPASKRKTLQYKEDKHNAEFWGRKFTPNDVKNKYEKENQKKDDAYDAFWIARYGYECFSKKQEEKGKEKGKNKRSKSKKRKVDRFLTLKEEDERDLAYTVVFTNVPKKRKNQ